MRTHFAAVSNGGLKWRRETLFENMNQDKRKEFAAREPHTRERRASNEVISLIFGRSKNDTKQFKVVFNLKALNHFAVYHKFKMETVESVIKVM